METSIIQVINQLKLDARVQLTDNISEADALLALQSKLKKNPKIQAAAKAHGIPIYVTKITKAIRALMNENANELKDCGSEDDVQSSEKIDALEEARIAIEQVVIPKGEAVELLPRPAHIVSLQMDLIEKYQLQSERMDAGSSVRIRILPYHTVMVMDEKTKSKTRSSESVTANEDFDGFPIHSEETNGSMYTVDRLPLLPD